MDHNIIHTISQNKSFFYQCKLIWSIYHYSNAAAEAIVFLMSVSKDISFAKYPDYLHFVDGNLLNHS